MVLLWLALSNVFTHPAPAFGFDLTTVWLEISRNCRGL
jgi:hypothetical protein